MSWKDYLTPIIISICIIFIIILFSISLPILYNWIFIPKSVTEVSSNIASSSTALIMALISIITLLITFNQTNKSLKLTERTISDNKIFNTQSLEKTDAMIKNNREYNEKTLKLTNETINQSEEIMYIQLRFDSAEKSCEILEEDGEKFYYYNGEKRTFSKQLTEVWTDIEKVKRDGKEILGYSTQKPEALLDRIIRTSSSRINKQIRCGV